MKRGALIFNLFWSFLFILWSSMYQNPLFAGIGAFLFTFIIFEYKKFNIKLYLIIIGGILVISLISSFIRFSSPIYHGNMLFNFLLAIFLISWVTLQAYDVTNDYKISKIFEIWDQQLRNQSQLNKDVIAIALLVIGLIVGALIGIYYT